MDEQTGDISVRFRHRVGKAATSSRPRPALVSFGQVRFGNLHHTRTRAGTGTGMVQPARPGDVSHSAKDDGMEPAKVRDLPRDATETAETDDVHADQLVLEQLYVDHIGALERLAAISASQNRADVARAATVVGRSLADGGKLLACGNGGSAADAQHFIAEFVGRYLVDREPLPALSLSSDPSIVTALGNDYGYDEVFARQVRALGRRGDVLIAISTSGRSKNVVNAILAAYKIGMRVIALSGRHADASFSKADVWCRVDSAETPHIQEIHTAMLHSVCAGAELILESEFAHNA